MKKTLLLLCLAFTFKAFSQIPSYVPANGLKAWYSFNGNGNDGSGYGNNLIPNGSPSYVTDSHGNGNSASHFPNGNDYFLTPSSSWSLINDFPQGTVSFWVKLDSLYVSNHYFGINNSFMTKMKIGVGEDLFFGIQAGSTKIRFQVSGIFPNSSDLIGSTNLIPNTWYHVAGIWDGISVKLYLNGNLDGMQLSSVGMSNRPNPDYFSIGSILMAGNGTSSHPSGTYGVLDDIGFWNRALTEQEITNLYNSLVPPTITSFYPTSGAVGTTVTILGTNFSSIPSNNIVYFGATKAVVSSATVTTLIVTVPIGATYQPISVLNINTHLMAESLNPFIVTFTCGGNSTINFATKVDLGNQWTLSTTSGDIDGDGKPDLMVVNGGNFPSISVYRNISVGGTISVNSFASKVDIVVGVYPAFIKLADIDGDGKLDLVFADDFSNLCKIMKNTSVVGTIDANTFEPYFTFDQGTAPASDIDIADLDGDGRLDITVSRNNGHPIHIFKNTTMGGIISFAPKVDNNLYSGGCSISDIDGDNKKDIVCSNASTGAISILKNISNVGIIDSSSFAPAVDIALGEAGFEPAMGDIDGDGKVDIVVINNNPNSVSVFKNTSIVGIIDTNSFAPSVNFATALTPRHPTLSDIDGDGKIDMILSNHYSNSVSVFRNNSVMGVLDSNSFASKIDFETGVNPYGYSIADFDGDGKLDMAVANTNSYSVSVLRNLSQAINVSASATSSSICPGGTTTLTANGASTYTWSPGNLTGASITVSPTATTTYSVTGINNNGCSNVALVTITVKPQPTVNLISNQSYCNLQTASAIPLSGTPNGVTFNITGGIPRGLPNQFGVTAIPSFTALSGSSIVNITPSANGCIGTPSTYSLVVSSCPPVTLHLKFYLEGYYQGAGLMRKVMYNQGETNDPNSIQADNVIVELHSVQPPYAMLKTTIATLNTDGTLTCSFSGSVTNTSYYIVVHHRNSVVTWSANPVLMTPNVTYDFSTSDSKAFGNNQVDVSMNGSIWAFYTGDLNQDDNIDLIDLSYLESDINDFQYGFQVSDINGDGNVDLLDNPLLENNINNFIFSSHP